MQTLTLKVNDSVFDKFKWLLSHFSKNEIEIVNEIDASKLSTDDFDYISEEELETFKKSASAYKNGKTDDFEEYSV